MIMYRLHLTAELKLQSLKKAGCSPSFVIKIIKMRLKMIPRIVWKRSCIKLYIIPNNNFVSSKSVNYDNHISNHTRLRFNDNWECFLFWNQNFCLQIKK